MKIFAAIFLAVVTILSVSPLTAQAAEVNCDNRYLTLINPVRGRSLWYDKSLQPLKDQYRYISAGNFPATWLLQYDTFSDSGLIDEIKGFTPNQEVGVFLEVSQKLGDGARVVYPYDAAWFSPRAVFLSGYSQSERRRLIDELFEKFKTDFGRYPKSVGAWWVDSFSLNYMKEKYGIKTALIVADQLTTDNYGVWGQWWGMPYYPSKANLLTPASSGSDKLEVAVVQWAQRDPLLSRGEGADFSNYSLQANDYIRQGKDTSFFVNLVNFYLDCQNPLGQVTVGLETGIESVGYIKEYGNQLWVLKETKGLQAVTMSEFADKFKQVYPELPKSAALGSGGSAWKMTVAGRENDKLGEKVSYKSGIAFADYFVKDKSDFLDRKLGREDHPQKKGSGVLGILGVLGLLGLLFWQKRTMGVWVVGVSFSLAAFGLILKSREELGWVVYYGPKVPSLILVQIGLLLASFVLIWMLRKFKQFNLWLLPLVFGLDPLIGSLRFTLVSGKYYFGVMLDTFRFAGLTFAPPFQVDLVNMDFPAYQAAALLRFNFDKIWDNLWLALIAYPLFHIFLAGVLSLILKRLSRRWQRAVLVILVILFIWHLIGTLTADPRALG